MPVKLHVPLERRRHKPSITQRIQIHWCSSPPGQTPTSSRSSHSRLRIHPPSVTVEILHHLPRHMRLPMYFPRINLIILVPLQQLDLHLQLQPKQKRCPTRIWLHIPRVLQQLITPRILIYIKGKFPPCTFRCCNVWTKLALQLSLELPPTPKSLTVSRRTPRVALQKPRSQI